LKLGQPQFFARVTKIAFTAELLAHLEVGVGVLLCTFVVHFIHPDFGESGHTTRMRLLIKELDGVNDTLFYEGHGNWVNHVCGLFKKPLLRFGR
jgi:hypothetical protein